MKTRITSSLLMSLAFGCLLPAAHAHAHVPAALSGAWYDPAQSGHGLQIIIGQDQRAAISWYTYGAQGGQAYVVGSGSIEGRTLRVAAHATRGGRMPGFDPSQVETPPWGELRLEFESCSRARLHWRSSAELPGLPSGEGQVELQRLLPVGGAQCRDEDLREHPPGPMEGRYIASAWQCDGEASTNLPSLSIRDSAGALQARFAWFQLDGRANGDTLQMQGHTRLSELDCSLDLHGQAQPDGALALQASGQCGPVQQRCEGLFHPAAAELAAGPSQPVVPLLSKPFAGEFPLGNLHDHEPGDAQQTQLGYSGHRRSTGDGMGSMGYDGHVGYDWLMPEGTPLLAVADGVVLLAEEVDQPCGDHTPRGPVLMLVHTGPDRHDYISFYGHASALQVREGDRVLRGQTVALSGNTGCSTAPHLHLHILRAVGDRLELVDPYGWQASSADPALERPDFGPSAWMWLPGEAPALD
ncbi:M23 family metallopeptidase [Aquimonas sp.]|jgi:hypothetical protein|uniref:M23 family metallopeptidase n=1 Tax=Aquimonas sp. TaxID=1872588 RepID=UPI0037C0EF34